MLNKDSQRELLNSIQLKEQGVIIYLPENTVSAEIIAKYMNDDGEIISVKKNMSPSDIYKARKDFEDNYIDPDAIYTFTDRGRSELL